MVSLEYAITVAFALATIPLLTDLALTIARAIAGNMAQAAAAIFITQVQSVCT